MELEKLVIKAGNEFDYSTKGDIVEVHYTGWLYREHATDKKGREFDGSRGRGVFRFTIGVNKVIKGWDILLPDMSLGEKAMLYVPSRYGYGPDGLAGRIPPHADLLFEVELLTILPQNHSSSEDDVEEQHTNGERI